MRHECPGPDRQTPNVPEEVNCPHCKAEVEVWSHDKKMRCPSCGKEFTREQLAARKK